MDCFQPEDVEDIEQDLLLYVLERADQFDPNQGNHKAFVTRILQSGVAQMLRDAGRQRNNPPEGYKLESFAKMVDGPELKSEELIVLLGAGDATIQHDSFDGKIDTEHSAFKVAICEGSTLARA